MAKAAKAAALKVEGAQALEVKAEADTKASAIVLSVFDADEQNLARAADKSDPDDYHPIGEKAATKEKAKRLSQLERDMKRAGVALSKEGAEATKETLGSDLQAHVLNKLKAAIADPKYDGKSDEDVLDDLLSRRRRKDPISGAELVDENLDPIYEQTGDSKIALLFMGVPSAPNAIDVDDIAAARAV